MMRAFLAFRAYPWTHQILIAATGAALLWVVIVLSRPAHRADQSDR